MSQNIRSVQNKRLLADQTILTLLSQARQVGPITAETIDRIADQHRLPAAWVRATAESYDTLNPNKNQPALRLCRGEACRSAGVDQLRKKLIQQTGQPIGHVTCLGLCAHGPAAQIDEQPISLASTTAEQALIEHLNEETPLSLATPTTPFYWQPPPVVQFLLPNFLQSERNPKAEKQAPPHQPTYKILQELVGRTAPQTIRRQIQLSQLRGRGGAGFPTGEKLEMVATTPVKDGSNRRFVVINADEGDAGSFIDKMLMESAPHLVLEGALLAAYAVQATGLYFYIRQEYPLAWNCMHQAVAVAQSRGLLTDPENQGLMNCPVTFVRGEGAYICGEETSLLRSIEGLPVQVSIRPPYPAQEGLFGCPTAVQNVETICNLPIILNCGAAAYSAVGTNFSRGTKLVSINNAVRHPGLYEVPFGTPIRTIIQQWAGGPLPGRRIQAVQIGGPLGFFLSPEQLDTPFSFEHLSQIGGTLGHGSLVVFDDQIDLLQMAHGLMAFGARESCGKCFPCRLGSVRAEELLRQLCQNGVSQERLTVLDSLCETLATASLCGLGRMLPIPIESLRRSFPHLWTVESD
ncbi:MAG: NAD(P)H-dependent oxidoreductase subunit E [Magnetococcales bacterium]|nr:NAD(P)H-dependent oxidoreductase subunit E [Magnetococcales bacterium]